RNRSTTWSRDSKQQAFGWSALRSTNPSGVRPKRRFYLGTALTFTSFRASKPFSTAFTGSIKRCVTIGEGPGERAIPLSQILRDQSEPVPVPSGQGRAEGFHGAFGPPFERAQRGARPHRLPPQPVRGVSPELHSLLRLRLRPRPRRRVRSD